MIRLLQNTLSPVVHDGRFQIDGKSILDEQLSMYYCEDFSLSSPEALAAEYRHLAKPSLTAEGIPAYNFGGTQR